MSVVRDKIFTRRSKEMMVEVAGTVAVKGSVKVENAVSAESLLKRAFMAMEDGELKKANEFFDGVLDISPECAEAYLGKLLLEYGFQKKQIWLNWKSLLTAVKIIRK